MPKDANSSSVLMGIDNVTGLPVPIQIDPVTGYVLAKLIEISNDPISLIDRAVKDGNSSSTLIGEKDDGSGVESFHIRASNGALLVDF
jgi:hypothetical protein